MAQIWFQHTFSRRRFQTRNQAVTVAILGIIILLILGSVYLSQVASFAITNRAIEELIVRRDELKHTNAQLIAEIARYRTVPRLSARAQDIGFRPASNAEIDYVVIEGYYPENRTAFVASVGTSNNVDNLPVYDETFGGWLEEQLSLLRAQFEAFGK